MADLYQNHSSGLDSPASHLAAIVAADDADLPQTTRAIAVAVSGFVRVSTQGGETGSVYVAAGVPFPLRVTRVWATGTTATDIVGLW